MLSLLWLLLPVAAASGWYAAKRTGKSPRDRTLPGDYIKGLNFLLNEQPDKAIEVFIRLVEVDSDTVETHLVLGNLFRKRGEVERAIRIHQNLIARPNLEHRLKVYALLELGRDYLKAGLLDRAEALFEEVVKLSSKNAEAYRHLLEIYEQEKEWQNAIDTATRLQTNSGVAMGQVVAHYYCELGGLELAAGRQEAASQYARKALGQDRNCSRASVLLGDVAASRNDAKAAIKHYSNVQTQTPELLSIVLPNIRQAYESRNDSKGYIRFLEKLNQNSNNLPSVLSLINILSEQGNFQDADNILHKALCRTKVPLKLVREYIAVLIERDGIDCSENLHKVLEALDAYLENAPSHICGRCGYEAKGFFWQCPGCRSWGTAKPFDEQSVAAKHPTHYRF